MNNSSTHYFFQYIYFAGTENSLLIKTDLTFDCSNWLKQKIEELVIETPEAPDELIDKILRKAKIC